MKSKRAREAAAPVEEDKPADIHATTGDEQQPAKKRKRTDEGAEGSDSGTKKTKKDKKEKKDKSKYGKESRKEKKEKRKDLLDLPEEYAGDAVNGEDKEVKEEKKKSKKDKKKDKSEKPDGDDAAAAEAKKDKKEKKKEKKDKKKGNNDDAAAAAAETSENAETAVPAGASNGIDLDMDANGTETKNGAAAAASKADRHIVFVGNLPYSATAASISAHFASLSPVAVRCLTNKGDAKNTCRGIAFVEFANVWTQRTCLDRFHHSMFEDGVSAARKINVELTAGGGGKTQHRKDKIREKNQKLDENRAKRIEKEKTAKAENGGSSAQEQQSSMEDAIHPSRRARVPGNRW